MQSNQNITIIDGHNWMFKSFYGVSSSARTPGGIAVNAVYGFFALLRQISAAYPDNVIFVAFDSETGIADKLAEKSDYKSGRVINTDMFKQLPIIKLILDKMKIAYVEHPKYEADDIIASVAAYWIKFGGRAIIASNDFDFVQMVSNNILLIRNVSGKLVNFDDKICVEKFGIHAAQYVDRTAICGDKSDHIAGVRGIGPKTAAGLLQKFGNLDGVLKNSEKLSRAKELALGNRKFIGMNQSIPIKEIWKRSPRPVSVDAVQTKVSVYLKELGIE